VARVAQRTREVTARVRVRIPSKVNLFLAVRGVRDDGFHELVSILQTVSVYDTVTAELERSPSATHPAARRFMALEFSQEGDAELPTGADNLAVRAAHRLMARVGIGTHPNNGRGSPPVTRLHLHKHIPVAAGMAGGSADAAAALIALNELWEAGLERAELVALAADLGSDVPFCVGGGTALATGTGTATAQVLTRGTFHWVIGISHRGLSTPAVYRAFDEVAAPSSIEPDLTLHALRTGDAEALGVALYNDLEVAACHLRPDLADAKQALLDAGALGAIVSGSGPTVVALAASRQDASRIAAAVAGRFDRVELAMSPAGGPEML
jgi:4-diphosphocytidyl-2-C-methyl-D-erythritol kinase